MLAEYARAVDRTSRDQTRSNANGPAGIAVGLMLAIQARAGEAEGDGEGLVDPFPAQAE